MLIAAGLPYETRWVDPHDMDGYGSTNHRTLVLKVARDVGRGQLEVLIVHEMLEAVNWHHETLLEHPALCTIAHQLVLDLQANGVDLSPLVDRLGEP